MNENIKIVCMIMGGNCKNTMDMCIESIIEVDKIYFLYDTNSIDNTKEKLSNWKNLLNDKLEIWERPCGYHNLEDINANSDARNYYLDKLKVLYPDGNVWCLVIDADEVVANMNWLLEIVKNSEPTPNQKIILSPRIHHFVYNLGFEDATKDKHYVPRRLFLINNTLFYPNSQHPVLQSTDMGSVINMPMEILHIWHFRECLGVFEYLEKNNININKSDIHTPGYLNWWYNSMLFGSYPVKRVDYGEIPFVIKKYFKI